MDKNEYNCNLKNNLVLYIYPNIFFSYRGSTGKGVDKNPCPFPILANLAMSPDSAPAAIMQTPNTICCVSPLAKFT